MILRLRSGVGRRSDLTWGEGIVALDLAQWSVTSGRWSVVGTPIGSLARRQWDSLEAVVEFVRIPALAIPGTGILTNRKGATRRRISGSSTKTCGTSGSGSEGRAGGVRARPEFASPILRTQHPCQNGRCLARIVGSLSSRRTEFWRIPLQSIGRTEF